MALSRQVTARDLIYTTNYVDGDMPVADVKAWFQTQPSAHSLGVLVADGQFGLITRTQLALEFLNHDGDPVFLKAAIAKEVMVPNPLVVDANRELETVINYLIETKGVEADFFDDIIVQSDGKFYGLLSVRDLFLRYVEGLTHQITSLDAQLATLSKKNRELFDHSFRIGKQETRFKEIFDRTRIPMIVFDENGVAVAANARFLSFTGFSAAGLDGKLPFSRFFAKDYQHIQQELLSRLKNQIVEDVPTTYQMELIAQIGTRFPVEIFADLTPDARHTIISIAQTAVPVAKPLVPVLVRPAANTETVLPDKPSGNVTQAIKMKLATANTSGLAHHVASNLIDRGNEIELLMKKLDSVIRVAEQVERLQAKVPLQSATVNPAPVVQTVAKMTQNGSVQAQHLQGNLANFSVIDLAQILVQGGKTGRLVLRAQKDLVLGSLYLRNGSIVHAQAQNGAIGLKALSYLLKLREGEFEFFADAQSPTVSISGDAMGILIDICRQLDEKVMS